MTVDLNNFDMFSEGWSIAGLIDGCFNLVLTYVRMIFHLPRAIFAYYITCIELVFAVFKYHIFTMPARPLHNEIAMVVGFDNLLGRSFSSQVVKMRGTVICVDSSKERGETFVKSLNDANPSAPRAYFYQCDVTRTDLMTEVVNQVTKEIGDISILVNCMEANVVATYFAIFKLVLPIMKGNKKGSLVFIRSSDFESRQAVQTLHESINKEIKDSNTKGVSTIIAHVFPKIALTSDDSSIFGFGIAKPDNVARSILEGVAKKRHEIYLPGYMVYCIFWIKLLPTTIANYFDNVLFNNDTKKKIAN